MVEAVRNGRSYHQVAREFHVSPSTVHHWVHHAHGQRLDRVDWSEQSRLPRTTQRTEAAIEDLVLEVRRHLQTASDLGFHGATTIRQALHDRGIESPPSVRTINRILRRRGAWTASGGYAGRLRRRGGICRRSRPGARNSTASTSSRDW